MTGLEKRLYEALKELQWSQDQITGLSYCPECDGNPYEGGHSEFCDRRQLLQHCEELEKHLQRSGALDQGSGCNSLNDGEHPLDGALGEISLAAVSLQFHCRNVPAPVAMILHNTAESLANAHQTIQNYLVEHDSGGEAETGEEEATGLHLRRTYGA
jgi:hypothetical protein